jgi:hypothetical protein
LKTQCSIDSATAGALGYYNLPDPYERIVEAEEPLNLGNHEIMTIKTFFKTINVVKPFFVTDKDV